MFLRPPKHLKDYGSWAIITGSTDGIGEAVAFELASKGLNLLLVGKNPLKLDATSKEIRDRYGGHVDVKLVVIDLQKDNEEEITKRIEEAIDGLDVGMLVNSAGLAYPYARFFHEVDAELMDAIIKVNVEGTTWVTKAVLPTMIKIEKRSNQKHWFWFHCCASFLPSMLLQKHILQCSRHASVWNISIQELTSIVRFHYLCQQRRQR